jgi:hypothetical protein
MGGACTHLGRQEIFLLLYLVISEDICTFAPEISHKYVFIMARPIKETPILYGEDARRFEARMKERRRISAEERARINADYELVLGMLKRGEELKQQRHAATV